MLPYTILALTPIIPFFVFHKDKKRQREYCLATFFACLFIILALRDISVGVDLKTYKYYFDKISGLSWSALLTGTDLEAGYVIFVKVFQIFSEDYRLFLVLVAFLSILPFYILYKRESNNALLTVAVFLVAAHFLLLFSALRQILAIGMTVPCFYFVKKKDGFKFLACVLIAFLLHNSAIILLLLYPIWHLRFSKKDTFILTIILIIVFTFRAELLSLAFAVLPGKYSERYGQVVSTGDYTSLLLFLVFAVYSFVIPDETRIPSPKAIAQRKSLYGYSRPLCEDETSAEDLFGLRNLLFVIIIIQIFVSVSYAAMRLNYYFLVFLPILLPRVVSLRKKKYQKLTELSVVVMIAFFITYFILDGFVDADILNIYPYIPFWKG